MKINFYLHLRTFMIGTIVTISAAILLTSLPEIEYPIFEDILDEDNGLYMLIHLLFVWNRNVIRNNFKSISSPNSFNQAFG